MSMWQNGLLFGDDFLYVKLIPQFGIRIVHKKVGSLTNILYLYR